jgi:hypothetical protein
MHEKWILPPFTQTRLNFRVMNETCFVFQGHGLKVKPFESFREIQTIRNAKFPNFKIAAACLFHFADFWRHILLENPPEINMTFSFSTTR